MMSQLTRPAGGRHPNCMAAGCALLLHREAHRSNDKTNKSGSHSLDNNPRVLAGQALHPKYKCIL
eukprot:COSAG01_NODE_3709_length_5770_cov_23.698819_5_plen_64_part_01